MSVVVPTYNRQAFVQQAVESALAQTLEDIEIIVVDDGSTDGTREALEHMDSRLHYLVTGHQGRSPARNLGANRAQAPYLAFLDSDDIWKPEKLARQLPVFEQSPHIGLVHGYTEVIDAQGYPDPVRTREHLNWHRRAETPGYGYEALCRRCVIYTSTVVVRRDLFLDVGGFDPSLSAFEDWDLYLRLALRSQLRVVGPPPVVSFRVHSGTTSDRTFTEGRVGVCLRHLSNLDRLAPGIQRTKVRRNLMAQLAHAYLVGGSYGLARSTVFSLIRRDPRGLVQPEVWSVLWRSLFRPYDLRLPG